MVRLLLLVLLLYLRSIISLDTNASPDSLDGTTSNEKSVTSATESPIDTVSPSSNSIGSYVGITRANLSDCFHKSEEELMCFIGSGCLQHKDYYERTEVHQTFVRYWEGLEKFYHVDQNRTVIEECDVGATLYKHDGYIDLQYHTNAKNWMLFLLFNSTFFNFGPPLQTRQWLHILENDGEFIDVTNKENDRRLNGSWSGELFCNPNCSFIENERLHTKETYFWSGKIIPRKNNTAQPNVKLVNISSCFADPKTKCYLGASCLAENDGMSRNHSQITFLDQNSMMKENVTLQLEVEKCNVAAILKRIGKHRPASYEFEFQTTEGNLQLGFHHDGMDICVENGAVVCTPNCEFEQSIRNESGAEKQLPRSLYWNGKINKKTFSDPGNDGKVEPKKLKEKDKISKNEDPDEEESEMGMILIICGCAVVALVIIVVIAGTIIQHRHNAKNKRKREAIERATAAKAAKESSSSTNLLKKAEAPQLVMIPGETVHLTGGTIVSDDEPTSEKTTSTQFGTLEK